MGFKNRQTIFRPKVILGLYIFSYFIVNLLTLTDFPFVHSDESWLSGLTRNMIDTGNLGVTETFFDLKPRYPHGIKILFHLLQMPFMAVLGYHIFSFRLLSLIFGCLSLYVFYRFLNELFKRNGKTLSFYPLSGTILLSLDIQFICTSHFARQEIILVFALILCLYFINKNRVIMAGIITGLAIGIHPNSFLLATMCAAVLFPYGIKKVATPLPLGNPWFPSVCMKNITSMDRWKPLLSYSAVTAFFAAIFVLISLFFDRSFFRHYLEYGNSEFEIGARVTHKFMELPYFLLKIWHGVSGTYYVPNIKVEMILFLSAVIITLIMLIIGVQQNRAQMIFIAKGLMGLFVGMILIGRYNQTSIIFIFPLFFVLILLNIDSFDQILSLQKTAVRNITIAALILYAGLHSYNNIIDWTDYSYQNYIEEIGVAVSPDNTVLANLNSEFYFENGKLLDYRNLSYLKENHLSIEDYIKKNKIEYIILSDELDLIYSQRPIWNIIYGNLRYLDELHKFTQEKCVLVHEFKDNTYGVRIVQFINSDRDFTVQVFKVKDFTG